MAHENILEQISSKGANIDSVAYQLTRNRNLIPRIIDALQAEKSSKKYAYEKVLRLLSGIKPQLVYPYFNVFAELLDADNSFLKWGAIMTIANLTAVDTQNKFENIFKKYYAPIRGPVMVTAANIIGGSGKIVRAKPMLADLIAREVLKVEKAHFLHKGSPSPECRNVAIGHAIDALEQFYDQTSHKAEIRNFIKRQFRNTRKQVAKKAEQFLRNHEGQ